ncbi:MAG TPA: hypothetical protein VE715_20560 [Blastocatellia bacterium]|nr:hypothetical protein [Blastocatellia bacterium]
MIAGAGYSGFPPEPSCRAAPLRKLAKINQETKSTKEEQKKSSCSSFLGENLFLKIYDCHFPETNPGHRTRMTRTGADNRGYNQKRPASIRSARVIRVLLTRTPA